jgi:citrate synthase
VSEQTTYSRGLEDIIATESSICLIDGKNSRLFYRGYSIHELAEKSNFEETCYLLLKGCLPTAADLADFKSLLASEREIPAELIKIIDGFPKAINPMTALRTGLSYLAFFDPEQDDKSADANFRKALRLIAKTPAIVAAFDRLRNGQQPVAPRRDPGISTAADFLRMLSGKDATAVETKMFDRYLVLLAEHDLNASTFAACITASTLSDIYSAIVSAVGTLKGDLHGSANSRAMESIIAVGSVDRVESYVDDALQNKKKLMGFGHRVYKGPDPRADNLRRMAKTLAENNPQQAKWYAISEKLEKVVWERKKLYCNVDFYSASVLYTVGIPVDLFTPGFAISRMAGWTAHVLEQYADNRLIRPVSQYTGKMNVSYVPIENRK